MHYTYQARNRERNLLQRHLLERPSACAEPTKKIKHPFYHKKAQIHGRTGIKHFFIFPNWTALFHSGTH